MNEKRLFIDLDNTLARFNVYNALNRFKDEEDFFIKLKPFKHIEVINDLSKQLNIYIISASPSKRTDSDKIKWCKKYLSNIKTSHILLCRLGDNKATIVKERTGKPISSNDYLLDDYTKNLNEWISNSGKAIKRLTTINNKSKQWQGKTLKDLKDILKVLY